MERARYGSIINIVDDLTAKTAEEAQRNAKTKSKVKKMFTTVGANDLSINHTVKIENTKSI